MIFESVKHITKKKLIVKSYGPFFYYFQENPGKYKENDA